MRDYVDAVVARLDALSEAAYLVGDSSGGAIVTQVAEYRPEKITALVYLAAFIPQNGESILGLFQQATESLLLRSVTRSEDQTQLTVRCRKFLTMDTDHSPFFSAPEELVGHLTSF